VGGLKAAARAALLPYNALLLYSSLLHPAVIEEIPVIAQAVRAWGGLAIHAASMAVLAAMYVAAGLTYPASWLAASSTGLLIEGLQALVPWREASLLDLAADVAGALAGLALAWALTYALRKRLEDGVGVH